MTHFATTQPFNFAHSNKLMKNRSVLAPLTHNMSLDNGDISDHEIAWLNKCCAGGFGMIITAATSVSMTGRCWQGQPALITNKQQQGFAKIAKNAHQHNVLAIVQLHHGGMRTEHKFSTAKAVAPSHYLADAHYPHGVEAISCFDIELLINDFVNCAKRAYQAGMDGIEIHAAFNFLLSNFSNPVLNQRTDQWGGSFNNRNRIIFNIVKRVRAEIPSDFIVGVRLSPENYAHFSGIDLAEQIQLSNALHDLGVDYIHMSLYDAFKQPNHLPLGNKTLLQWIKSKLNPAIPLMIAGNISTISAADQLNLQGADLVAIGKAAVGNPDWVNKINAGKTLIKPPYSYENLAHNGFTHSAIDYMTGINGLVAQEKAAMEA
ncbi:MAG: NADH:flavin oxidoreductase [Gammaproteobacteria bacterium]|nr:NADH:flavin oxidoreductase [Gammaproteobacteria bacterium]